MTLVLSTPISAISLAILASALRQFGFDCCRYNNGRFYLLVDGPAAVAPWKMTRNQDLNVLHVDDANQWAAPLDAKVVSGDTLIFDFVYFLHPVSLSLAAHACHPGSCSNPNKLKQSCR